MLGSVTFAHTGLIWGEICSFCCSEETEPQQFNDLNVLGKLAGSSTNQYLIQPMIVLLHVIASEDKKKIVCPLEAFPN